VEYSPLSDRRAAIRSALLSWYDDHARDLPWRRTKDPYAILVSEVMLQQTQVDRVLPKYQEFLALFPTVQALAEAPVADVIRAWAPLGYNRRAVNLQRAARKVIARFGGRIPSDAASLRGLPGIGRYTAAAVACFAFDRPEPVVDTNVRRVLARLEGLTDYREADIERLAAAYLPPERAGAWSQALMDLSSAVCRPSSPLCLLCPVQGWCQSSGSRVREARGHYRAAAAKAPFAGSDRYLRGRIIDVLRGGEATRDVLAEALGLNGVAEKERLDRILAGLARDGLLQLDPELGTARLPA
jgi:A/G-specific adenine glycosylase